MVQHRELWGWVAWTVYLFKCHLIYTSLSTEMSIKGGIWRKRKSITTLIMLLEIRISFWGRIPVYDGMDWLLYFPGSFLYYIVKWYHNWFIKLQILGILFYISFFAIVKVQYHEICTLFIVLCCVVLISSVLFRYIWFFWQYLLVCCTSTCYFLYET